MNINHDALLSAARLRLDERRRGADVAQLVRRAAPRRRFRIGLRLPRHWAFSLTVFRT